MIGKLKAIAIRKRRHLLRIAEAFQVVKGAMVGAPPFAVQTLFDHADGERVHVHVGSAVNGRRPAH